MAALFGKTRLAVLSLLYLNENRKYYLREIIRELGLGQGAAQRELARLAAEGLLDRTRSGNRVYYQANSRSPDFTELKVMLKRAFNAAGESSWPGGGRGARSMGAVNEICARYHVRRLAVFGSSLNGEGTTESDLDLLVEFEPGHTPGLAFFTLEDELSEALGRKVDLNTPAFLSRYFREAVIKEAQDIYGT